MIDYCSKTTNTMATTKTTTATANKSQLIGLLSLLVICYLSLAGLATLDAAPLEGETTPLELPHRNLMHLSEMIREEKKPDVELVFAAYEDYVKLHKIEAGLAGSFGDRLLMAAGEDKADETRAQISQILKEPYVKIISENLFCLLPDEDTDGHFERSPRLQRSLARAINSMGL